MAVTDPIADMLTVIRNASRAKKDVAEVRNSKLSQEILKVFKENGFITAFKVISDTKQGILRIHLYYNKKGVPAILGVKRISKPGLRIYKQADALPRVYGGLGIAVISTSRGIMTDTAARQQKVGGEVICSIW